MNKLFVYSMLTLLCLTMSSCQRLKNIMQKAISTTESSELTVNHLQREGSSKYQDAEARLTLDADYPKGDSKAAIMLRRYLYETTMDEPATEDIKDEQAFFDKLLIKYRKDNSPEMIKAELENGTGEGWFYNIRFKKEWENEHMVSFTYSADAFNVGNATSSAWIKDITVSKADGRTLAWDMFRSKSDVKSAIDELLIAKYGCEGADIYDQGIPMPDAPLFLANGVRFDFSDYSILMPHVYEETGEYPCCLLTYDAYGQLLTDEARQLLGLQNLPEDDISNSQAVSPTTQAPTATPDDAFFAQLVNAWDEQHSVQGLSKNTNLYTHTVRFYGVTMEGAEALHRVQELINKTPDFSQKSRNLRITRETPKRIRCDFDKYTTHDGKTNTYPSYLVFTEENGAWLITEESDYITDRNLAKRRK